MANVRTSRHTVTVEPGSVMVPPGSRMMRVTVEPGSVMVRVDPGSTTVLDGPVAVTMRVPDEGTPAEVGRPTGGWVTVTVLVGPGTVMVLSGPGIPIRGPRVDPMKNELMASRMITASVAYLIPHKVRD